jgi:Xaa-Pro aminopeptidase
MMIDMKDFFTANREQLIAKLNGGVVVLSAYASMQRANDFAYTFEQESNFWWLTGIESPDWQVIIDGTRGKSWAVAPYRSHSSEIFDGSLSPDDALRTSGVSEIITHDKAIVLLRDLAKKHSVVYTLGEPPYAEYFDFVQNPAPKKMHDLLSRTFSSVQDCRKELSQLRAIKQPLEITLIKKVVNLTVDAFETVKQKLPEMSYEYDIEAEFSYYFRKNGAVGHAYDPIVASGKNACTLHYVKNSAKLKKRDLLLLDIGARRQGYAADVSRTFALGEISKRQQEVHSAVSAAHAEIINLLKPDYSVEQYQRDVDEIMTGVLMSLGLMKDAKDEKNYRKYFPHAISHGLGIDPHDSLGAPRFFQPNMVLTVEPGVYIPEEGIGVRIEDDILITATGNSNLSARLSTEL